MCLVTSEIHSDKNVDSGKSPIISEISLVFSPVQSRICPLKTRNLDQVVINLKLVREENSSSARIEVLMESHPVESGMYPTDNTDSGIILNQSEISRGEKFVIR